MLKDKISFSMKFFHFLVLVWFGTANSALLPPTNELRENIPQQELLLILDERLTVREERPERGHHSHVLAMRPFCTVQTPNAVSSDCEAEQLTTIHYSTWSNTNSLELDENIKIDCNSNEIAVDISTKSGAFNGMIYPKGLSKNSSCLAEFLQEKSPVRYRLPLRSCNTMSTEMDDGGIEYFNTIVVQPHLKLVTNQGRGFHIRCIYTTKDQTISHNMNFSMSETEPLLATAPMPGCTMKIYYGDPNNREVAENVKIGDPLTLVIAIDSQDVYGLKISDCLVRDGLGWGEQYLINEDGCPVDDEIMGQFKYSNDKTVASVRFQAHKFPYTDSVYYQCNVKLCIKSGGCSDTPPNCNGKSLKKRRQVGNSTEEEGAPATIEVYSGLYVNEASDGKNDIVDLVHKEKKVEDPDQICISQKNFAIGIAIAGLILILLVILAIIFLLARRRKQKDTGSTGSSIYSGPYTNTAYSHSS